MELKKKKEGVIAVLLLSKHSFSYANLREKKRGEQGLPSTGSECQGAHYNTF